MNTSRKTQYKSVHQKAPTPTPKRQTPTMSGNPFDGTRSEVTHAFLHEIPVPPPELRDPQWAEVFDSLRALFKALAEHDAMARNNSQLFSTPAHDKNAQYFCWDFVFRTIVG